MLLQGMRAHCSTALVGWMVIYASIVSKITAVYFGCHAVEAVEVAKFSLSY
jgi:hypothetical protein